MQYNAMDFKQCEKKLTRLLTRGPKLFCLLMLLPLSMLYGLFALMIFICLMEDPEASVFKLIISSSPLLMITSPIIAMLLLSFFYALFPKKTQNFKRMSKWGNKQDIYRSICKEFFDPTQPPKKAYQLWTTPHFILLQPHSLMPKLYYLPCMTGVLETISNENIIYFSDGGKISFLMIRKKSLNLLKEAIAGYM